MNNAQAALIAASNLAPRQDLKSGASRGELAHQVELLADLFEIRLNENDLDNRSLYNITLDERKALEEIRRHAQTGAQS